MLLRIVDYVIHNFTHLLAKINLTRSLVSQSEKRNNSHYSTANKKLRWFLSSIFSTLRVLYLSYLWGLLRVKRIEINNIEAWYVFVFFIWQKKSPNIFGAKKIIIVPKVR